MLENSAKFSKILKWNRIYFTMNGNECTVYFHTLIFIEYVWSLKCDVEVNADFYAKEYFGNLKVNGSDVVYGIFERVKKSRKM